MKILHLSTSDMGGAGIAAKRLHLALLEQGQSSKFLTLYKLGETTKEHYLIEDTFEQTFIERVTKRIRATLRYRLPFLFKDYNTYLKNRPKGYEHFSFPYSMIDLTKSGLVREADVIHLHWVSDGFLDYGSFFSQIKKPVIWTLHDMNPFTGGCHHSDGSMEFVTDCLNCKQIKGTKDESIAAKNLSYKKNALQNISDAQLRITTPSHWLGALSEKSTLFRRFRHSVIPNIVDEKKFIIRDKQKLRREFGIDEKSKVILFVANDVINPRKGIQELIEAINSMNMENLVICTVGRKMDEGRLNKPMKQFGFITSEDAMSKIYAMADVFALPSHAENFPNSIIEAFLCGIPVVASRIGGIPEQVDKETGILFSQGNIVELMEALLNVLKSTEYKPELIRQKTLDRFGSHKVLSKYISLYNEAIDNEP